LTRFLSLPFVPPSFHHPTERFLAQVVLPCGTRAVAHCPNTGPMLGLLAPKADAALPPPTGSYWGDLPPADDDNDGAPRPAGTPARVIVPGAQRPLPGSAGACLLVDHGDPGLAPKGTAAARRASRYTLEWLGVPVAGTRGEVKGGGGGRAVEWVCLHSARANDVAAEALRLGLVSPCLLDPQGVVLGPSLGPAAATPAQSTEGSRGGAAAARQRRESVPTAYRASVVGCPDDDQASAPATATVTLTREVTLLDGARIDFCLGTPIQTRTPDTDSKADVTAAAAADSADTAPAPPSTPPGRLFVEAKAVTYVPVTPTGTALTADANVQRADDTSPRPSPPALFPDTISVRALKHVEVLHAAPLLGERCAGALLWVALRGDVIGRSLEGDGAGGDRAGGGGGGVGPCWERDPTYAAAVTRARAAGLGVAAVAARLVRLGDDGEDGDGDGDEARPRSAPGPYPRAGRYAVEWAGEPPLRFDIGRAEAEASGASGAADKKLRRRQEARRRPGRPPEDRGSGGGRGGGGGGALGGGGASSPAAGDADCAAGPRPPGRPRKRLRKGPYPASKVTGYGLFVRAETPRAAARVDAAAATAGFDAAAAVDPAAARRARFGEVTRCVADAWRGLTEAERDVWRERAVAERERDAAARAKAEEQAEMRECSGQRGVTRP